MLRTDKQKPTVNPAKQYWEWKAEHGAARFERWDGDLERKVRADTPFRFIVLGVKSAVTGYSQKYDARIWSNEVDSTTKEQLEIFAGRTKILEGNYKEIKGQIKDAGGKFTVVLYVLMDVDGVKDVALIKMSGAGCKCWLDFKDRHPDFFDGAIEWDGAVETGQTGAVKYDTPVFRLIPIKPETVELANEFTEKLADYFNSKKSIPQAPTEGATDPDKEDADWGGETEDDIPF